MIYPRVREHVEFDELVALGNAGLAEAAQRYEPDRGATFATFAWYRVQGAIVDGLRKMTEPAPPRRGPSSSRCAPRATTSSTAGSATSARGSTAPVRPQGADALAAVKLRDVRDPDDVRHVARGDAGRRFNSADGEPGAAERGSTRGRLARSSARRSTRCPTGSARSSRSTTGRARTSSRPARSSGSRSRGRAGSTRRPWSALRAVIDDPG